MALMEKYIADFNYIDERMNGSRTPYVGEAQKRAIKNFADLGFPSTHLEDWRYTPMSAVTKNSYKITDHQINRTAFLKDQIKPLDYHSELSARLVFVNGIFCKDLSVLNDAIKGLIVCDLKTGFHAHTDLIKQFYSKILSAEKDSLIALNTAFSNDGAFIWLDRDIVIEKPIEILYISDSEQENVSTQSRNLIVAGKNAQATIVEKVLAYGKHISFNNYVNEKYLGEGSHINFYQIQNFQNNEALENATYLTGSTQVIQEKNSVYNITTISLGTELIRNDLNIKLQGEGAEAYLNGLYLPAGKQLIDNHSLVDHAVPNCHSDELYKGVMQGNSKGVFNGKIIVRPDAQKTLAYQSNRNLLLSDSATINTKPQLEIFADDVKCSHGATTGQLDEEALFYIRSRGISKKEATAILTFAFVQEIVNKIKPKFLRAELTTLIAKQIGA